MGKLATQFLSERQFEWKMANLRENARTGSPRALGAPAEEALREGFAFWSRAFLPIERDDPSTAAWKIECQQNVRR